MYQLIKHRYCGNKTIQHLVVGHRCQKKLIAFTSDEDRAYQFAALTLQTNDIRQIIVRFFPHGFFFFVDTLDLYLSAIALVMN